MSRSAAGLLLHRKHSAGQQLGKVSGGEPSTASPGQVCHLHFHHVDGVPASFNLLGSIASLLDENDPGKSMIQVPEVHRGDAALKITGTTTASRGSQGRQRHPGVTEKAGCR